MPDSFQPPIGTPGAKKLKSTSLTFTAPHSIRRATVSAFLLGPKTVPESP